MLTKSSANVSDITEGNAATVEFSAGFALVNVVWAEAGRAINERTKIPPAITNFGNFMLAV
jgi:hypothetical protein